jgi:hypothetical protein
VNREKQFNVRLTSEEAANLELLARKSGVTPSELVRHLIQELASRSARPALSPLHLDLLTALAGEPQTPLSVIELLNRVASKHEDAFLGTSIGNALVEMEHLGHVERAPLPGRVYRITVSGVDLATKRR